MTERLPTEGRRGRKQKETENAIRNNRVREG